MCEELVEPKNGRIEYSSASPGNRLFGVTATYVCKEGFELIERETVRTCNGDGSSTIGNWTGSTAFCTESSE